MHEPETIFPCLPRSVMSPRFEQGGCGVSGTPSTYFSQNLLRRSQGVFMVEVGSTGESILVLDTGGLIL